MGKRIQRGFTLIEVALVLLIAGLVLGMVLKAQELMTTAKVRNIAVMLDGTRVAYLAFMDRYHALPGDVPTAAASRLIPGAPPGCTGGTACGNQQIDDDETYLAWNHLSSAGLIYGRYTGTISDAAPTISNNPRNIFNGYLHLVTDARYDDSANPAQPPVLNIKTGVLPSRVLAELDRKLDDGHPLTGEFRSSGFAPGTAYDGVMNCHVAGAPVQWNASADLVNCGGAVLQ